MDRRADARQPTRRDFVRGSLALSGALLAPAVLSACGGSSTKTATGASGGTPQRGGTLRVATSSGSQSSFDPQVLATVADEARARVAFDCLADYDTNVGAKPALGEEFTPSRGGRVWTIKLREATFHDGTPVTADHVVASFRRIIDEKTEGHSVIPFLPRSGIRKLDQRTVRFELSQPIGDLPQYLAHQTLTILPDGFDPKKPVGTGPFAFVSFDSATNVAVYKPYRESWRVAGTGKPYVDELRIVGMAEPAARVSALIGGQIDIVEAVDTARIGAIERAGGQIMETESGAMPAICMQTDKGPFRDVRVRQAMRLIGNRPQDGTNAFGGHARVGNDLSSWVDEVYAGDIPQRQQDLEQAKSLLRAAGQADLRLELYTADVSPGVVSSGTLFAQEAAKAGVAIKVVKQSANDYYELGYGKQPMFMTSWNTNRLDIQVLRSLVTGAPFPETQWSRPAFDRLATQARGAATAEQRKELFGALQRELHEEGGYIVQSFRNYVDGLSGKVRGLEPSKYRPLGWFGLEDVWLS